MNPIEADKDAQDYPYGDESSSYSASLASSVLNYAERDGRRYHAYKEGRYFLPNDDKENGRLDIMYQLVRAIMNNELTYAPISKDIGRAIDLGTGTGTWVLDFADDHEATQVIGNDLSPIQPSWVPTNVKFVVDDFEEDWQYELESFDYVHGCHLVGSVRDWPRLLRQAFKCTNPGGWVEFQDWDLAIYSQDGTLHEESSLQRWNNLVLTGLRKVGAEARVGAQLETWMTAAGFVDIEVVKKQVPVGTWPKDKALKQIGILNYLQLMEGLEAISLGTLRLADATMTAEQIQEFLVEVRKDLSNPSIHSLYDL